MLFKRNLTRGNTKKRPGFLSVSSNRTLYLTFMVSILFHAGLICSIPAVNLFSEGLEEASSDMIVVDVIQEEIAEIQPEVPQAIDDQFLASQPVEPDMPPEDNFDMEPTANPNDIEIPDPPPIDKSIDEMGAEYTLLTNPVSHDPEIEYLRKRPVIKRSLPVQQKISKLVKPEKLPDKHERPQPPELIPPDRTEVSQKPSISPIRVENSQKKVIPEERLHFPLEAQQLKERQFTTSTESIPEKHIGFGKRSIEEFDRNTPVLPSSFDVASQISKKRQFGLPKENENDENRFGIFAGKKFEVPQMKETVQEAMVPEKSATTLSEETEKAKKLETNSQIEGPVKGRAIVYQPSPPQVDIENEVEFQLKFWVLPDGTIGEVIPIKRGDATLERIAIAYLKKWQFEPLSPDAPQQKIWGTIPIKFTMR